MVKPVTIKLDERIWKQFKAINKTRGIRLEAALDALFRDYVNLPVVTAKDRANPHWKPAI